MSDPAPPKPSGSQSGSTAPPSRGGWLNRTLLGAGVTSLLGDLSYETATVLLPGFLAALAIPAAALGAIEGVADALSSLTRLASGVLAERLGHRKGLVCIGYGLTPAGQALIAAAGGWPGIFIGRALGWLGRGLRGPLRDAIVAESIPAQARGRAFGFHRASDTVGAVLGPLLGIALLAAAQARASAPIAQPFRRVLWLTLIPGGLSVLAFALLVRDRRAAGAGHARPWRALLDLPPDFRRYLAAVGLFGAGDFAPTLLILAATDLLGTALGLVRAAEIAGLLYVLRNIVQALVAYPAGALADRIGHRPVLVLGYALGVLVAVLTAGAFLLPVGTGTGWRVGLLGIVFALGGAYVAVEETLEASLAASLLAPAALAGGYGALGATNGFGDLVSSAAVGALWSAVSPSVAFGAAAAVMALGTLALSRWAPKA